MGYDSGILRSDNYQPPAVRGRKLKKKKPYGKGVVEHYTTRAALKLIITDTMRLEHWMKKPAAAFYERAEIDADMRAR